MDSSTHESRTGKEESEKKSALSAGLQDNARGGESVPRTKKEILAQYEAWYNEGARWWNSLPGHRLIYPQDKFTIKYCYCTKKERKPITDVDKFGNEVTIPYCNTCGFALPGAYED